MKKRVILFVIITLILSILGTCVWIIIKSNNVKPLYKVNCEFVNEEKCDELTTKMTTAQSLYNAILSSENRITVLQGVVSKLDNFERDLNTYLVLSNSNKNNKTAKKLSKEYSKLIKERNSLLTDYNEYITRMSGNINADGIPAPLQNLYNELFNKTVLYLRKYNKCFNSTSKYVFAKVYKIDTIKSEVYSLYSLAVDNLLNNISNNKFASTTLITKLNSGINLTGGVLNTSSSVIGGEFSRQALNFKRHFNNSDLAILINNFNNYYSESIDPSIETSNEKLAVYYVKLVLGL